MAVRGAMSIIGNLTIGGNLDVGGDLNAVNVTATGEIITQTIHCAGPADLEFSTTGAIDIVFAPDTGAGAITQVNSDFQVNADFRVTGGGSIATAGGGIQGGNLSSTTNSLNGITIPATGGTLAKLTDIMTPGYLCIGNTTGGVYGANAVIPWGASHISGGDITLDDPTDAIYVPDVATSIYQVSITLETAAGSQFYLADGAGALIAGTEMTCGIQVVSWTVVIPFPTGRYFTVRAGAAGAQIIGGAGVGRLTCTRIK